ncbi:MAG: Trk system potassium transporter TrkA [Chlamydiia bacterium]|nr:Trk system potassium transporter TrkA [Chlamydiia bacterium]
MLNIVIIGAGRIGAHMAELLSKAEHNVIVVDIDKKKIEDLSWVVDVATRVGSGTDWQLLDDLLELNPDWLIALTSDDENNLVACSIAKHLGYPNTIARVKDNRFLNRTRLDFARIFDVDHFVGPELLVAHDMLKYMVSEGSVVIENFANGAVQLRTILVPKSWKSQAKLKDLKFPDGVMVGLIKRGDDIIFPHGDDTIKQGDEVTFIGETDAMDHLSSFIGHENKKIESVVIVGGSLVGLNLALLLEKRNIGVRLIDKNYDRCQELAEKLNDTTIMNHDITDLDFIRAEKIPQADLITFCTLNDETNLLGSMLLKEEGAEDVVVMLSGKSYDTLAEKAGVHQVASPRISAANRILSQILSGRVSSLISLYDNRAEVIEVNVGVDSKVVGIPLSDLGPLLPPDFLVAMIQNRGRIMVANGSRIISPGDTVIVISGPEHISELESIF